MIALRTAGAGIVVRNSIILVDFIELRRTHGQPLRDAVVEVPVELALPVNGSEPEPEQEPEMEDDADNISPDDRVILIVENDTGYVRKVDFHRLTP